LNYRVPVINGGCAWANPQEHKPIPRRRIPEELRPTFDAHRSHATQQPGYSWEYPDLSASKAVLMENPAFRDRATQDVELRGVASFQMPNPGACILLAPVLEWTNITSPTVFETYRIGGEYTPLFWSPSTRLLFAHIPKGRLDNWRSPTSPAEKKATAQFEAFRWGQDSRGVTDIGIPDDVLYNVGVADTILYRSGKGTEEMDDPTGVQEYIHQFGYGVHCYQDDLENPSLVCWRGGDLDVVKAGIVN
jgi:hypothetical protein